MNLSYRKDLSIASITSESNWNQFKIHTLLQNPNQKQPSINAYLGARYSRSADSILDIASEIIKNNTDASERLEKIFTGYGHKSVGDMADLFVCIENIPLYVAMRIFYMTSVVSGQERSTRFQNFEKPEFAKIPKEVCNNTQVSKRYEELILKEMKDYRELLLPTKEQFGKYFKIDNENPQEKSALQARSFDTARYLLPLGINTSSAYLMSARNWSEMISWLCASDNISENEIADMLLNLLGDSKLNAKGYIREADNLIKHTDANCCRKNSTREVLKYLENKVSRKQIPHIPENALDAVSVSSGIDGIEAIVSNYELLLNPLGSNEEFEFSEEDQEKIGEIIFENHDHHNLIGNIGQAGSIKITGFADLGVLKDLNRHRSMERYIPWLHDEIDLDQELNRPNEECVYLCNYLNIPEFTQLREQYLSRLSDTYNMIRKWRIDAKEAMAKEVVDEYTKYLFPYAHCTKYVMYGSFDDIQYVVNLRTRNGGHIAYRSLTYEWLRKLSEKDPIWKPLVEKIPKPQEDSREQFVDRS
jgi:thymidylate synthase ThyX